MDMVKGVTASGIGGPAPPTRDSAKPVDTAFSVTDAAAPHIQNARLSTISAIGMESMLALQAVDEAGERDRRTRKRAGAMIAKLTELQRAMLARQDPSATLQALTGLAADGPETDDPGLAAILRSVALRCRIEIARREHEDKVSGQP
jgi:Class II flagellar assembly regulator